MFVSVGSASNVGEGMDRRDPAAIAKWEQDKPAGAAWGNESERADVLVFDPQGKGRRIFATGIRNCVGLAVNPTTGDLWCSTNERDGLGDNLPPDYITRVREGGFYGWPWYYMGAHEDPRHRGERPDLKDKITVPDVMIQPHSASLQLMFYTGDQFPAELKGSVFAAEHGSWNRSTRTGYKIIRAIVQDGVPTGEYEDFVTGFVHRRQLGVGPAGRRGAGQGRVAVVLRGRQRHDLAGEPRVGELRGISRPLRWACSRHATPPPIVTAVPASYVGGMPRQRPIKPEQPRSEPEIIPPPRSRTQAYGAGPEWFAARGGSTRRRGYSWPGWGRGDCSASCSCSASSPVRYWRSCSARS